MPLIIPNSIDNDTPADAAELQENFTAIRNHININTLHRDGSVAMDQALVLPGDPTQPNHAANKDYVDGRDALLLPLAGGTVTGQISGITPTAAAHLTRKDYVDSTTVSIGGDTMTGPLLLDSPQSANAAAAVRYDWLAARQALYVAKAGDTMTGNLFTTDNFFAGSTGPAHNDNGVSVRADGAVVSAVNTGTYSNSLPNFTAIRGGTVPNDVGGCFVRFMSGTTIIGEIEIGPTNTTTRYLTSSDYRLKDELGPVEGATERLNQLRPIHFRWKGDGYEQDGFLAHEVDEVVPAAVSGEKDAVNDDGAIDPQMIDNNQLVPLLTAALQEALRRIAALEAAA